MNWFKNIFGNQKPEASKPVFKSKPNGSDKEKSETMNCTNGDKSETDSYNDLPIFLPSEDHFGIDPFTQALADSFRKLVNPKGAVIALNGVWGSGKSSATNLIRHHLKPDVEAESLVIINFACWWFRGEEALALAFFRELYAGLSPSLSDGIKKVLSKIGSRLLRVGSAVAPAIDIVSTGGAASAASGSMKWLSDLIEQGESLEKLHEKLSKALIEQKRRFLIVIDDIDRLSPDEAILIFRLVKSVGRLPNVMYLLVYDRILAESIISERFPSEGPHYLEKIVQAAFELPEPQHSDLCNQLLQKIQIISGVPEDSQLVHFMNLFYEIIAPEIRTPRDVMRLANTLSVTWPSIAGEINMGDFISIETLRLFQPQLYRTIRQNKTSLCQNEQSEWNQRNERGSELERLLLQPISEQARPRYRRVLMRLFPPLESFWNNFRYSGERQWAKDRRICSASHFDIYFRFSLGDDTLRKSEIDSFIKLAGDEAFIKSTLQASLQTKRGLGGTKAALILDELTLHAEDVSTENILPLLSAIFCLGDELNVVADKAEGFSIGDNYFRIHWLLRQLTRDRLSLSERSAIFMKACSKASIGWLMNFSRSAYADYYPREGKEPSFEADCLTTLEHAEALKALTLQRIGDAAVSGELLTHPDLPYFLYLWADWTDDNGKAVKSWTATQLANEEAITIFATAFTSYSWSQGFGHNGMGDLVARRTTRAQVKSLNKIMNNDLFRNRLEEIEHKYGDATSNSIKEFLGAWRSQEQNGDD